MSKSMEKPLVGKGRKTWTPSDLEEENENLDYRVESASWEDARRCRMREENGGEEECRAVLHNGRRDLTW